MAHQTVQHPNTALIRAQNARSIARRASVSALAQSVARTSFASLSRNPRRQIGGRFEAIIEEPDPIAIPDAKIPDDLINQFFSALEFAKQQRTVRPQRQFQFVGPQERTPFGRAGRAVASRSRRRTSRFSGRNRFTGRL